MVSSCISGHVRCLELSCDENAMSVSYGKNQSTRFCPGYSSLHAASSGRLRARSVEGASLSLLAPSCLLFSISLISLFARSFGSSPPLRTGRTLKDAVVSIRSRGKGRMIKDIIWELKTSDLDLDRQRYRQSHGPTDDIVDSADTVILRPSRSPYSTFDFRPSIHPSIHPSAITRIEKVSMPSRSLYTLH